MSLRTLKDILIIIFNPRWWLMNHRYSSRWDRKLNDLMKTNTFTNREVNDVSFRYPIPGECVVKLGEHEIWVANYPYAAFCIAYSRQGRPSRLTIMRARRKLEYDALPLTDKRDIKLDDLIK